jgi:hypothetical protein
MLIHSLTNWDTYQVQRVRFEERRANRHTHTHTSTLPCTVMYILDDEINSEGEKLIVVVSSELIEY